MRHESAPDQFPERDRDLAGVESGRQRQIDQKAGAALGEHLGDASGDRSAELRLGEAVFSSADLPLGGFADQEVGATGPEREGLAQEECDSAPARRCTGPGPRCGSYALPHKLSGFAGAIQPGGLVGADPPRQHFSLPHRGREGQSLQLRQHLPDPVFAYERRAHPVLPDQKEPLVLRDRCRPRLAPPPGERGDVGVLEVLGGGPATDEVRGRV